VVFLAELVGHLQLVGAGGEGDGVLAPPGYGVGQRLGVRLMLEAAGLELWKDLGTIGAVEQVRVDEDFDVLREK
jgi:hypothetical protein